MDVNGNSLPPERGRNVEVGMKFGDASQPFTAVIALFELTRQNVANSDPQNPLFYVVTGEQRSRGVELEGAWAPTVSLEVQLGLQLHRCRDQPRRGIPPPACSSRTSRSTTCI